MSEASVRLQWDERELDLFDAFVAGFEISAEGYNGEWMSPSRYPTPEAVKAKMVEEFTAWRNSTAGDSDAPGAW